MRTEEMHMQKNDKASFISEDQTAVLWEKFAAESAVKTGITACIRHTHPRIFVRDWAEIKAKIREDVHAQHWYETVLAVAEEQVNAPPTAYFVNIRHNINDCSTAFKNNVIPTAAAYCLTGNIRYKNRVLAELENVGGWPNWGANAYLCTAHILMAFALCYDWLYNDLTAEEKSKIVAWICDKGLQEAVLAYELDLPDRHWWAHTCNNWNCVCNGSNFLAALAVADDFPQLAEYISKKAADGIPYSFTELSVDGAYAEPLGYWGYGIRHLVKVMAALRTSLTEGAVLPPCLDFSAVSGLNCTCDFPIYYNGITGAFNYGDGASEHILEPCMYWLADFYNKPAYTWYAAEYMNDCDWSTDSRGRNATMALLWYNAAHLQHNAVLPLDKFYSSTQKCGANGLSMRASWAKDTLLVMAHGGDGDVPHGNLDAGGFVLDWNQKRWIHLYGRTPPGLSAGILYSWPGYHRREEKNARFMYYHTRAEANNTVIVNPQQDMPDMYYQYRAPLVASHSNATDACGVFDLTTTNKDYEHAERTVALTHDRTCVAITDNIVLNKPSEIYWFANTTAQITLAADQKSAVLRIDGDELLVRIAKGPQEAVLEAVPTVPLPTSPNPSVQPRIEEQKLCIHLRQLQSLCLTVEFIPLKKAL